MAMHPEMVISLARMQPLIFNEGRELGLPREDLKDAGQEAYFWFQEAVEGYLPEENTAFTTFLHQVVSRRLLEFVRHFRRVQSLQIRVIKENTRTKKWALPEELDSERDHQNLLQEALGKLDESDQTLWQERCAGKTLKELAPAYQVCYKTMKRRWKELCKQLKEELAKLDY